MGRGRAPAATALATGAVLALWAMPGGRLPGPAPAAAADNRAAVLIDTGTQVKHVCVRFAEDSISGAEALARANVDAVVQGFSGKGVAVCALCGVGCPPGESCLTCDPGGRYWSYSRAPAGAPALRPSPVGASSTQVHDGDVEGWAWGLGGTPAYASVGEVCDGVVTTTSTAATTSTAPVAVTTAATTAAGTVPRVTTTSAPVATTAAPAPTAPATTAPTTAAPSPSTNAAPGPVAAGPADGRRSGGGGGGWTGLAAFAAALAGVAGWGVWARRARRRRG
ncbi:MAG TPA: hypothetical protein VFJ85_13970 [Acidimicrobiales bacterium]|nr:hypothetical protein [Acidimicrobiales bacterium]